MAVVAYLSRPQQMPHFEHYVQFASRGLDAYADDASRILREGGIEAWRAHLKSLDPKAPVPIIITDRRQPLLGEPIPPNVMQFAEEIFARNVSLAQSFPHHIGVGRPLLLPDRTPAVLVVMARKPGPRDGPGNGPPPNRPGPPTFLV